MSADDPARDPLVRHLDAAAEHLRQANHHTYTVREVTDLYPALGALHALFTRFDQLAGYLLRTVRTADAIDYRHDQEDDIALALTAVEDGIDHARELSTQTAQALAHAWAQVGHLALDIPDLVCPECGEPAHPGTPTDLAATQRTAGIRPRYRHADGTQLCPVLGPEGYQPAPPHAPDIPSSIHQPDPEGQH
jgi:hypothetical protein